jgi:hypothetical protein
MKQGGWVPMTGVACMVLELERMAIMNPANVRVFPLSVRNFGRVFE